MTMGGTSQEEQGRVGGRAEAGELQGFVIWSCPLTSGLIQKLLPIRFKEKMLGFWKEIPANWTVNY